MSTLHLELRQSIIDGKKQKAVELTGQLLSSSTPAKDVLEGGLISGMQEVGRQFKAGDKFVPEVLVAARAMKAAMELLRPELVKAGIKPVGTMVIGTVKGDLHDIGKNLVAMMAEGAGFRVVDLGVDVPADKFLAAAREHSATVVAISALLTTTMMNIPDAIKALEPERQARNMKVVVGGAPVTKEWAQQIGADGYAPDAAAAVDLCLSILPS
jgi:5-methyltetrahydrofolate--homocysteine methyltransferase